MLTLLHKHHHHSTLHIHAMINIFYFAFFHPILLTWFTNLATEQDGLGLGHLNSRDAAIVASAASVLIKVEVAPVIVVAAAAVAAAATVDTELLAITKDKINLNFIRHNL
jgi:hypothetical protein